MGHSSFDWSCELPNRKSYVSAQPAQRAILIVRPDSAEEERLSIPVAVGRMLRQQSKALDVHSRAELLYELKRCAESCAWEKVCSLGSRRDYSSKELDDRLKRNGYTSSVRELVVKRALSCGLIDNDRFASAYIRTKLAAGWGERRIALELSHKGIELGDVPGWPEEFIDPDNEVDRALSLLERKSLPRGDAYGKLMRFLVSRGFRMGCARAAVERRLSEIEGNDQR